MKQLLIMLIAGMWMLGHTPKLKAQVINIEDKRIRTDTTGWSGSGELAFYANRNNDLVLSLQTDLQLQYKTKKSLLLLLTDISTVQVNEIDRFVNSGFQHIRYNYKLRDRFVWEAFAQGQYNGPLDIDYRLLAGSGPRFKVFGTDTFRLYVAALYMYEIEANPGELNTENNHRMSSYISFTFTPNDNVSIVSTTYYQPNLADFKDTRISTTLDIKSYLTEKLYLKVNYNMLVDSRPVPGIVNTIFEFTGGVGLEF